MAHVEKASGTRTNKNIHSLGIKLVTSSSCFQASDIVVMHF